MRDWQSKAYLRNYCRYHVVFVPKCRKKALYASRSSKMICIMPLASTKNDYLLPALSGYPPRLMPCNLITSPLPTDKICSNGLGLANR